MKEKIKKTEAQWQAELGTEKYHVLRNKGTEPAFTGKYYDHKADGIYHCSGCGEPLFESGTKYDSGSGWPSFDAPLGDGAVETEGDTSHGMNRVEVHCSRCEGHLGHVFEDGPASTGLRYCINSASLDFKDVPE